MNAMVQNLKDMGKDIGPVKLAALVAVAIGLIGLFLFISLRISAPVMTPLYSNLAMEDSAQIVSELDKTGIPYELRANGTQILVAADQVTHTRLNLAQQGLPSGGSMVGYEIFDRSEMLGTSNFVLNVNMIRALEGELSRTIGSLAQVESARVHLVIPKRELFSRDKQEPSASISLKLRGTQELARQEVEAIRHLVATAVPGLKPMGITIVDNRGRLLAKGGEDENSPEVTAANGEEFRVGFENRMKKTIESLLERSLGDGKVKVNVTADIDFDRIVTNSEIFDPEGQVARSVQESVEKESSSDPATDDTVSVANNLPEAQAKKGQSPAGARRDMQKTDGTTNYEISKKVTNHVKETGTVKRLSVAVLVDGVYTKNESGDETYTPRVEEELKQIESLVKTAAGFDEKRGDTVQVVNMRFSDGGTEFAESPFDWILGDLNGIIQTLVIGGVAILAILLLLRPLVNRALEGNRPAMAGAAAGGGAFGFEDGPSFGEGVSGSSAYGGGFEDGEEGEDAMINIDRIQAKVKSSSFKKINDIIDKYPEESLGVLRQWMYRET